MLKYQEREQNGRKVRENNPEQKMRWAQFTCLFTERKMMTRTNWVLFVEDSVNDRTSSGVLTWQRRRFVYLSLERKDIIDERKNGTESKPCFCLLHNE